MSTVILRGGPYLTRSGITQCHLFFFHNKNKQNVSAMCFVALTCESGVNLEGGELEGHLMLVSVDDQVLF